LNLEGRRREKKRENEGEEEGNRRKGKAVGPMMSAIGKYVHTTQSIVVDV
jgi:hypothetical protein